MWSFEQAANAQDGGVAGTTIAKIFPGAVLAGNLLFATASFDSASGAALAFSDDLNGAWPAINVLTITDGTNQQVTGAGFLVNSLAGTPTVTATVPNVAFKSLVINSYPGIVLANALDGVPTAVTRSSSVSHTSNAVTISEVGALVIGVISPTAAGTSAITSTDVSIDVNQAIAPLASNSNAACGQKVGPLSGSVTASFTLSAASIANVLCFCFKVIPAYRRVGTDFGKQTRIPIVTGGGGSIYG